MSASFEAGGGLGTLQRNKTEAKGHMANDEIENPASHEIGPTDRVTPVAGIWHTVLFVVILLGLAILQGQPQLAKGAHLPRRMILYISTIAYEFFLLGYVWLFGLRRYKVTLGEIIGGKWLRWGDFWRDVGIALLFWIVVVGVLVVMSHELHFSGMEAAKFLLPETALEAVIFVLLSCVAGFCEEVIFRGYLQRQFTAWTGNVIAGIVLQSASIWRGAFIPGAQRRDRDYCLRRDVWNSGVDAEEPATGNNATLRAGLNVRNRWRFPEEVSLPANHQVLSQARTEGSLMRGRRAVLERNRNEVAAALGRGLEDGLGSGGNPEDATAQGVRGIKARCAGDGHAVQSGDQHVAGIVEWICRFPLVEEPRFDNDLV